MIVTPARETTYCQGIKAGRDRSTFTESSSSNRSDVFVVVNEDLDRYLNYDRIFRSRGPNLITESAPSFPEASLIFTARSTSRLILEFVTI